MTLRCQCGSIDFTDEDPTKPYETPRATHWVDKPCVSKVALPTYKNHYEETLAVLKFNGSRYEEDFRPDGTHVLMFKDNGEVWFYYSKDHRLILIRSYDD